ncbi:hypothetical protein EZS27_004875 [termite gut metagenome]|uniref:DUF4843 domain-containing protein n=1 Tax=termite gut metagenome TaxID=433724 RepID=A0A5J4SRE3_9ZZZZ
MKTTNIALFISLLILLASCDHDSLPTYKDVDRIYFQYAGNPITAGTSDQVKINLGYDNPIKSDSIVRVKVKLMGHLSDVDRPFKCGVISQESSAVQGEDVEILFSVIPAGKEVGDLLIKVKNSTKIETTTLLARIRLLPNEYFHVDYTQTYPVSSTKNGLEYNIYFDCKTDMPSLWADPSGGARLTQYFGKYSNVKFDLICEVCGVTREYFMHNPEIESAIDVVNARIPTAVSWGWISQINRYLTAYKNSHDGEPLRDENGEEIKMGLTIQ